MVHKLFTLNIRKYLVTQPRTRRRNKAIKFIRQRIAHYTKITIDNVKIDQDLNSSIIKYYAKKMSKIKLDANIEDNKVLLTHVKDSKKLVKPDKKFEAYTKLMSKTKQAKANKDKKTEAKKE